MTTDNLCTQIGACLVMCQRIEFHLAVLLCLERGSKDSLDAPRLIVEFAKVRGSVFGQLKKELMDAKAAYLDFAYLDSVIERRNWLVHHLSFDPAFQKSWDPDLKTFRLDLSDHMDFFERAGRYCFEALVKRGAELGCTASRLTAEAGADLVSGMADSVGEIRDIRKKGKKKG